MMLAAVALAILATMLAALAWEMTEDSRVLEQQRNRLQATWLARSGVELAGSRLLAGAREYTGESVEPIPKSLVRVEVRARPGRPQSFEVTCTAHYPNGVPGEAEVTIRRHFKRTSDGAGARIEAGE
jgi:hypothetical protein